MSYSGISVKEAMEKINCLNNGWYLPQVQRQYVWGARYESETYICLLLDSLFRRYPIGGLVLWETDKSVPFREFINEYYSGTFAKHVDSGRWVCHKSLIYDGQQRLQTLKSVLYYTFNGRILCFNLLFEMETAESDETGFFFIEKSSTVPSNCIKMTELSSMTCGQKEKVNLETKYTKGEILTDTQKLQIRTNLGSLWDVFVDRTVKSIAFFSVISDDEKEVNEIFRRLNTGGIALTQLEMVLSKIKAQYPDYEERLWELSSDICKKSGGFTFTSAEILQYFYLLVFDTINVEEDRVKEQHVQEFNKHIADSAVSLVEFFAGYLWGQLKINHVSIVPRRQAMLPIAAYLSSLKTNKHFYEVKRLTSTNINAINEYFILSQFCDWNTQTMVNAFARITKEAGALEHDFPIERIKLIATQKNRSDTLYYHQFLSQPWLAIKILTPNRYYIFHENKPQVDHIFPLSLKGTDDVYAAMVDVLWNLQPMPAGVNNYKRARHPGEFFKSTDGAKYFVDYDFLPSLNNCSWDDPKRFIRYRHKKMRQQLFLKYGIKLKRIRQNFIKHG
jgi:hypothetical protein